MEPCYRKFEIGIEKGAYDKIAADSSLIYVHGKKGDSVIVVKQPDSMNVVAIKRDDTTKKDVIQITAQNSLQLFQSKLEGIIGFELAKYEIKN